jgi:Integrase core domain
MATLRIDHRNCPSKAQGAVCRRVVDGICERFHKTIVREFYQVAFKKMIYRCIEKLQVDLDAWVGQYNNERTHQSKVCRGRPPTQTRTEENALRNAKVNDLHSLTTASSKAELCWINSKLLHINSRRDLNSRRDFSDTVAPLIWHQHQTN